MTNTKQTPNYTILANLYGNEEMDVYVGCRGEKKEENLYILNKIYLNDQNTDLFKRLYIYFNSPDKINDFKKFFVSEGYFYSVFSYKKADNIKQKYNKNICTTRFDDRCKILEYILMKIDKLSGMPLEILESITHPENILVDMERHIHILYTFENISKNKKNLKLSVFKNIRNIIFTMLQAEAEAKYNKALHVVLEKCEKGVYESIPQLVVDLKKAEQISKHSSWISYIKYQLSLRKPILNKYMRFVSTCALFVGVFVLVRNKLNENNYADDTIKEVAIGGVTYASGAEDESDKNVTSDTSSTGSKKKQDQDITLTPGLDIEFEDYVVQQGDTIASICNACYNDNKYTSAVASFNNMDVSEKLVPGDIIKLPNKTEIALYISK